MSRKHLDPERRLIEDLGKAKLRLADHGQMIEWLVAVAVDHGISLEAELARESVLGVPSPSVGGSAVELMRRVELCSSIILLDESEHPCPSTSSAASS